MAGLALWQFETTGAKSVRVANHAAVSARAAAVTCDTRKTTISVAVSQIYSARIIIRGRKVYSRGFRHISTSDFGARRFKSYKSATLKGVSDDTTIAIIPLPVCVPTGIPNVTHTKV